MKSVKSDPLNGSQLERCRVNIRMREHAVFALMDLREAISTSSPERFQEVVDAIYHALDTQLDYLLAVDSYPELRLSEEDRALLRQED